MFNNRAETVLFAQMSEIAPPTTTTMEFDGSAVHVDRHFDRSVTVWSYSYILDGAFRKILKQLSQENKKLRLHCIAENRIDTLFTSAQRLKISFVKINVRFTIFVRT